MAVTTSLIPIAEEGSLPGKLLREAVRKTGGLQNDAKVRAQSPDRNLNEWRKSGCQQAGLNGCLWVVQIAN